jgi:Fe2+ or Zn2+ uptake regulation protein
MPKFHEENPGFCVCTGCNRIFEMSSEGVEYAANEFKSLYGCELDEVQQQRLVYTCSDECTSIVQTLFEAYDSLI